MTTLSDLFSTGKEDVFYKAEMRYCYRVALFGGILGLIACGSSMYQSCRDINAEREMQTL